MTIEWSKFYADRAKNMTGSQIRQFFALTERPEVISFAGGFPGNEFFPGPDISESLASLVLNNTKQALQYTSTEGILEFRTYLANRMSDEGSKCKPANLIITDGSQQGLDLLARIFINPEDHILVEEPAYIGGVSAFKAYGGKPLGLLIDEEGVIPEVMDSVIKKSIKQGKKPKLFYTVPNFQNPTGVTTSLQRRKKIYEIASSYDIIIIEDNPYGSLCYEGDIPQSYHSMDSEERVIYLGSYSKILIPGIRIGWMAGSEGLIEKVTMAKQTANLCSSSLGQQLAYNLSVSGYVDNHVSKLIDLYREKRDTMINSMKSYFPSDISFTVPKGGFFTWVAFPDYYPTSREILELALKHNVAFVHGEGFYCNGGGLYGARFSYSQPPLDQIEKGIKVLGDLFHKLSYNGNLKSAAS